MTAHIGFSAARQNISSCVRLLQLFSTPYPPKPSSKSKSIHSQKFQPWVYRPPHVFKPMALSSDAHIVSRFSIFSPNSTPFSPNTSLSLSLPSKSIQLSLSCSKVGTFLHISGSRKVGVVRCAAPTSEWVEESVEERWENEESEGGELVEVEEGLDEVEDVVVSEDAKVFVGNLSYEVDSEQLAGIFGRAGTVEIAEVICKRESGQSRGFAFVTMNTVEEAEKAVEMFNRYDVNGRLLTVNKAAPRGAARPEHVARVFEEILRIYIGNLPWQVNNERLEQVFSEHGEVVEARVVHDRETGRSYGFGFVTMSTETEMQDAINALDGESLEGRSIKVNVAESRAVRIF